MLGKEFGMKTKKCMVVVVGNREMTPEVDVLKDGKTKEAVNLLIYSVFCFNYDEGQRIDVKKVWVMESRALVQRIKCMLSGQV